MAEQSRPIDPALEAAGRYVSTALIIDDEISLDIGKPKSQVYSTLTVTPRVGDVDAVRRVEDTLPNVIDRKIPIQYPHIMAGFAKYGVHFTAVQPEWLENNGGIEKILRIAVQSDIIILDWKMKEEEEGKKALEILEGLSKDAKSSLPHKLRLVLIYTGQPADGVKKRITDWGKLNSSTNGAFDFEKDGLKVVVLIKNESDGTERDTKSVSYIELADKSIEYFARSCDGLIPSAAMDALSAVRETGHMVLKRFEPDLDYPALVHRSAIPTSGDAEQFITALLSSEIGEIVTKENPGILIRKWKTRFPMDENIRLTTGTCTLEMGIHDFFEFGLESCANGKIHCIKTHPKEYKECINDNVGKVRFISDKLNKSLADGVLTSKLSKRNNAGGKELDEKFDSVTKTTAIYSGLDKNVFMSIGIIIMDVKTHKILVCLRPKCDSIRLNPSSKTRFPFLKLDSSRIKTTNIQLDTGLVGGTFDHQLNRLKFIEFTPLGDRVTPTLRDGKLFFMRGRYYRFEYVGDLKPEFAQKLIDKYVSDASRIGVDEPEQIRVRIRIR